MTEEMVNTGRAEVAAQAELDTPDLAQAAGVVIQTFAVFVGISLTDFFDETKNTLDHQLRFWAFIALVALLLRFIIGSAIHFNQAYGKRRGQERPLVPSVTLFVKDLLFLLVFGYLAIQITHSHQFVHFVQESTWFIGFSLLWSVTEQWFRSRFQPDAANDVRLNQLVWDWIVLDLIHFLFTVGIRFWSGTGTTTQMRTAALLAIFYVIFFLVDMAVLLGRRRLCKWPPLL